MIVIEHNLDLIAAADCVIDLGPEGGDEGGRVVAWGTPEQVARSKASRTAPYLREHLNKTTTTGLTPRLALLRERLRAGGAAGAVHPDLALEEGAVGDRHHARLDARLHAGRGADLDLVGDERRAAHLALHDQALRLEPPRHARAFAHAERGARPDVSVERARHVHVARRTPGCPRSSCRDRRTCCSRRPRRCGAAPAPVAEQERRAFRAWSDPAMRSTQARQARWRSKIARTLCSVSASAAGFSGR